MMFSEKLQIIRENRGLTQEELAEKLSVSRQTVAKWEAGHTYPDITNLIGISNSFNAAVDYLVRGQECSLNITDAQDKDIERLILFRLEANVNTYTAYMNEASPTRLSSHDFAYTNTPYLYHSTYIGGEKFASEEIIQYKGNVQYMMNYCGRVLGQQSNGDFLKKALRKADMKMPYRGPEYYQSGEHTYKYSVIGDLTWFQGYKEIYCNTEKVYGCYFHSEAANQNLQICILSGRW